MLDRRDMDSIPLASFYEVFRRTLIGTLTEERFVDLYAQTKIHSQTVEGEVR